METRSHEVIAPTGHDVTLAGGRTITVKPVTVGQLPRFVKAIRPAFGALVALAPVTSSSGSTGGQGSGIPGAGGAAIDAYVDSVTLPELGDATGVDAGALLDLYVEHGPSLNSALCIVTDLTQVEVDALNLEEAFLLVTALWEVNQDFFARRVMPLLRR